MGKKEEKRWKKRAAATAVAAAASAGVIMGGAFASPDELMRDDLYAPPATDTLLTDDAAAGDDDGGDAAAAEEEERRSPRARVRSWVWRLPAGVRALVGVPLWCVGWLILSGASALWGALLSPVAGRVLGWLAAAALLLGAFALTGKAAFPDLPLKKILTRKNFLRIFLGVVVLAALDSALPLVWGTYDTVKDALRAVGMAVLFGGVTVLFLRKEKKRRRKQMQKETQRHPLSPEEAQKAALREAREMVDAVR